MKFYIQESTGSHRSQAAGDAPENFIEATEEEYDAFVSAQEASKQENREAARLEKQAACDEVVAKLVESTSLPAETIKLALGI